MFVELDPANVYVVFPRKRVSGRGEGMVCE